MIVMQLVLQIIATFILWTSADNVLGAENRECRIHGTSKCSIANQVHFDAKGTLEMGRLFALKL